jgi:uncharacterized protein YhbP (UPF0306 family)
VTRLVEDETIQNFLTYHKVLNLAYISKSKENHTHHSMYPRSCALWYVHDTDLNFYYLSEEKTHHGSALKNGGKVSFTINEDNQNWMAIKGIQGTGYANIISENQYEKIWEWYTRKFEFVTKQFFNLDEALKVVKIWKVIPNWLRYIDNSIKFGFKEEIIKL